MLHGRNESRLLGARGSVQVKSNIIKLFRIKHNILSTFRRKRQVKKEMKSSPSFSNSNTPNNNNIDEQMDDHFFKEELNLKTDVYFPTDLSPIQFYKRLKPEQEELINRLVSFFFGGLMGFFN